MRALHLYTGLFLVPWMTVYAVSDSSLNHSEWFEGKHQLRPKWEVIEETDFATDATFPTGPEEQAKAILKHLDLDGAHFIRGTPTPNRMRLFRYCSAGHYQITWHREPPRLVVEEHGFHCHCRSLSRPIFRVEGSSWFSGRPSGSEASSRRRTAITTITYTTLAAING